jgi:cell division protein FtsW
MLDINTQKYMKLFFINITLIAVIGIIMVYSSSYIYAREHFGTSYHFLIKQSAFLIIGVGISFILSKTKYNFWYKHGYKINFAAALLVMCTFLPGIGISINGSRRWLDLMFMSLQPSEIIKFTMILASIKFFEEFNQNTKNDKMIYGLNLFLPLVLLALQPDFGSFSICASVIMFTCFLSSFPRKYFYSLLVTGFIGGVILLISAPYRVKRLLSFLDPWSDPKNTGFQIIQSYLAFANGSLTGQGIGNSKEKLFYLPEAYNDFIFSVIGEEMGFFGVFAIVLLFLSFIYLGFKLAITCTSRRSFIFIATVTFLLGLQAFLNMGVVLGILPTKGLNLPFISYGGSSLIANLIGIGLIISSLKNRDKLEETNHRQQFRSDTSSRFSRFSRD